MKPGVKTTEAWGGAGVAAALLALGRASPHVAVQCVCYGGAAVVAAAYVVSWAWVMGKAAG